MEILNQYAELFQPISFPKTRFGTIQSECPFHGCVNNDTHTNDQHKINKCEPDHIPNPRLNVMDLAIKVSDCDNVPQQEAPECDSTCFLGECHKDLDIAEQGRFCETGECIEAHNKRRAFFVACANENVTLVRNLCHQLPSADVYLGIAIMLQRKKYENVYQPMMVSYALEDESISMEDILKLHVGVIDLSLCPSVNIFGRQNRAVWEFCMNENFNPAAAAVLCSTPDIMQLMSMEHISMDVRDHVAYQVLMSDLPFQQWLVHLDKYIQAAQPQCFKWMKHCLSCPRFEYNVLMSGSVFKSIPEKHIRCIIGHSIRRHLPPIKWLLRLVNIHNPAMIEDTVRMIMACNDLALQAKAEAVLWLFFSRNQFPKWRKYVGKPFLKMMGRDLGRADWKSAMAEACINGFASRAVMIIKFLGEDWFLKKDTLYDIQGLIVTFTRRMEVMPIDKIQGYRVDHPHSEENGLGNLTGLVNSLTVAQTCAEACFEFVEIECTKECELCLEEKSVMVKNNRCNHQICKDCALTVKIQRACPFCRAQWLLININGKLYCTEQDSTLCFIKSFWDGYWPAPRPLLPLIPLIIESAISSSVI